MVFPRLLQVLFDDLILGLLLALSLVVPFGQLLNGRLVAFDSLLQLLAHQLRLLQLRGQSLHIKAKTGLGWGATAGGRFAIARLLSALTLKG